MGYPPPLPARRGARQDRAVAREFGGDAPRLCSSPWGGGVPPSPDPNPGSGVLGASSIAGTAAATRRKIPLDGCAADEDNPPMLWQCPACYFLAWCRRNPELCPLCQGEFIVVPTVPCPPLLRHRGLGCLKSRWYPIVAWT